MSRINRHRQHKWSGIASAVLLPVFCISGIILNHRDMVSDCDVSRKWLPSRYEFKNWNGGLLRGTVPYHDKILIYGVNGMWITDTAASSFADFNTGLPTAADHRQIRGVVERSDNYYALTPEACYKLTNGVWKHQNVGIEEDERLSDITLRGDTLVVVGRSNLYFSTGPDDRFKKHTLPPADEMAGKVSLFKTVWMLHSGELFGIMGKIIVDIIALILTLLSVTGLIIWLLPKNLRRRIKRHESPKQESSFLRYNLLAHNRIGGATIVLTILIAVTGWCLRPPVMIPLALNKTCPIPGTTLDRDNPWHDKLRMMRYDDKTGDWLLSTSDGFYSLGGINAVPAKIEHCPPVSVMGLNVWERDSAGTWLCGSFSGMFRWDRDANTVTDYFSDERVEAVSGPPFGKYAASGYSRHFNTVVEYYEGTRDLMQPEELRQLPMSLWNIALEAHSGRLFIGSIATYIYIFFTGLIVIWCLYSGWKVRKHKAKL